MARPPFLDSSTASSERQAALAARWRRLGIREEDIDESFVRSSGKGGQNVNKVSSCVDLLHRPSGIRIKCQAERSQLMNRYLAREQLANEVERRARERIARIKQEAEARRRKARPMPRKAKARMLDEKRARGKTKAGRRPVSSHE